MPGRIRRPQLTMPDFSHVTDPFEGLRLPTGSSNPWEMCGDMFQRYAMGEEPAGAPTGPNPYRGNDLRRFTPEYVQENGQHLGMSEHTPDQDFLNEFIAHQVTGEADESMHIGPNERRSEYVARMHALEGMDRHTPEDLQQLERWHQESDMLRSWGMNPEIGEENEVYDPVSGLYAVRYDPLAEGDENYRADARSITSFAGTHSLNDLRTDAETEVGSNQYDQHRDEIQRLIHEGTEGGTITGHSLGGYLAQRAAVDATDHIGEVVTFQAGGLDHEHADAFEANRGNIDVRHHSAEQDFVHLAGEQRLAGQTFHHHSNDGQFGHTQTMMAGTDSDGVLQDAGVDEGTTAGWDDQDRQILEFGRRGVATARHAVGTFLDPAWYTAEDLIEGGQSLRQHGGRATDMALAGGSQALAHASEAGSNALNAASDLDLTRTLDALSTGGSQVVGDLASTGGALMNEASSTFDELSTGAARTLRRAGNRGVEQSSAFIEDVLSEADTGGRILTEGARRGGALQRAGMEAIGEAGHAVWDAGAATAGSVMDTASDAWNALWD